MKYTITAVIPTVQYGNIQPSIEVEADTFEEANAMAMPHIEKLWAKYSEKPLPSAAQRKKITAYVGGDIYYDDATHTYTNEAGDIYMSGSQYAKSLEKPFDLEKISEAMANKFDVSATDIKQMWKLKSEVSAGFGTAIHKALELYGRFQSLSKSIDKQTNLHDHPVIKKAVQEFYEGREKEKAVHEVFIVDHRAKRAGQIDRMLLTGPKQCRIQDFKTNADIQKSINSYWIQLQFYADIMIAAGYEVTGLDIFHWNGGWTTYSKELKNENKSTR
jgi:hypothetical protein